ncbi:MAG: ABC transporter substrate-binding protein [bacterium]|nr:ABC transporter substrate-binding protein [bacterium]
MNSNFIISVLAIFIFFGNPAFAVADEIRIGALYDLSAATADVGKDYALGIAEAVRYVNDEGGVNGKPIKLYQYDYGYRVPEVIARYKQFKRLGVVAVLGWHIVDTDALSALAARDKIPYLAANYSAALTNPKKSPFNVFAASDDSSNARAALTAWFDEKWPLKEDYGTRRPRVQFAYMFASAEISAPVKAIKDQAELFGFNIGPDQDISIFATNTRRQVQAMKNYQPDFVWHGNTALSVAATIREASASDLEADHIVNSWAFDKNLVRWAGETAEGVMGASVCAYYGEDVPMMEKIKIYGNKYHPGVPEKRRLIRTTQAWANVLALREALKRADSAGDLSGENIMKKGFETFEEFDIGLRVSPLTYTSTDHRGAGAVNIYQIKNRKFVFMTKIDLIERWPVKWANEWFGW